MRLVKLVREGEQVKFSRRAGNVVTLEDLLDEVGADVARYFYVRSSHRSEINFDLELAVKQSDENPVFYVQYAHARTCNVARNAVASGVTGDSVDTSLLNTEADNALLAALGQFAGTVKEAADFREPHRVARYLENLAAAYHRWYGMSPVAPKGEEEVTDLHRTRLLLNNAARQVLANGLGLLGVTAPEKM